MNTIISIAIAIYGAYSLYTGSQSGLSVEELYKGIAAIIGGTGYAGYTQIDKIKSIISRMMNMKSNLQSIEVTDNSLSPDVLEQRDFECLTHLRKRFLSKKNEEGISTCQTLSDILYRMHNEIDGEK